MTKQETCCARMCSRARMSVMQFASLNYCMVILSVKIKCTFLVNKSGAVVYFTCYFSGHIFAEENVRRNGAVY